MNKVGVCIPALPNRLDNVVKVLDSIENQTSPIDEIIVVCDGWEPAEHEQTLLNHNTVSIPKHKPGLEAPRNAGVRWLDENTDCDYVWFLDSDVVPEVTALEEYKKAADKHEDAIFIGPYEWLGPGARDCPYPEVHNDPRWDMFNLHTSDELLENHLGAGLGNFSGNLMWPIKDFIRVGGFWNELHAGRCDDGELGARALLYGMGMVLVKEARAYHLYHDVNTEWVVKTNAVDVPKLNDRHPWIQGEGIEVAPRDGKRLEYNCSTCGQLVNTGEFWIHYEAQCLNPS